MELWIVDAVMSVVAVGSGGLETAGGMWPFAFSLSSSSEES